MFKKALSLVLALMLVVSSLAITAVSVSAADGDQETWILAGTESFFGSNWFEADENNKMEAVGDGTYTKVYEQVQASDATIQCKVTNGTWEVSYPANNYEFKVVEACDVTFTFDPATQTLSVSGDGVELPESLDIEGVNAVGAAVTDSPNWLNGISWDPSANEMVPVDGQPGVFTATFEDVVEDNQLQFKFAFNGTQNKAKGGTGWEANIGGKFVKTGEWTEGVWNGDNLIVTLPEIDDETDETKFDITLSVDTSEFDYSTKQGAKFMVQVFDKEGKEVSISTEEEEATTAPAEEEGTTAAEVEETTAAAEPGTETALSVKATSNYFPEWTTNFTAEELEANNNLVTVTYYIDLGDIEMVNAAFVLKYDPTVLKYEAANNTHKIGKKNAETIMPYVKEFGGVVDNPTFAEDTMKGNCSDATDGYIMTGDPSGVVPFVSVTFTAIGTGNTTVDLELELMQIADKDADENEYYYVKDSAIVKEGVDASTQTSVYGGTYQESYENPEQPATQPATQPETEAQETTQAVEETTVPVEETTQAVVDETTQPVAPSDDFLKVNAVSNILASTDATFKGSEIPEQVTVKYYLNSEQATLVNSQVVIKYDPAVLSLNEAANKNSKNKWALSPVALDWGTNTVVNVKMEDGQQVGEIKVNFSDMDGITLNDADLPLYQIVFDVVGKGETTVDCQVETITFKDAGTPASDEYWYQPQTLAGGFNQDAYNQLAGKSTMKTTINDISGGTVEPETTTPAVEPTTSAEPVEEGFFYVVGNAALVPTGWAVDAAIDDAETQMHLNGDGLYEYVFKDLPANEPKAMYQLKVIEAPDNDAAQVIWHGLDGTDMNVDFVVTAPCDVTVTYNPETGEIKVTGANVQEPSADYDVLRVVGGKVSGSPNYMNSIDWNPAADENVMTKVSDGVYQITFTEIGEFNNYMLKFTADSQNSGDWSINWGGVPGERQETANGYVITGPATYNGDNIILDCEDDDDEVDFVYDLVITFDLTNFNPSTKEGATFTAEFIRETEEEGTTSPEVEPTTVPVEPTTVEPTTVEPSTAPAAALAVSQYLNTETFIEDMSVNVGENVEIVYALQNDLKLVSTQWTFTYDPTKLQLVDATENFMPFTTEGAMYNTENPGEVRGSVSNIDGFDFTTEATFVKVTLKALESGSTNVNLQLEAMYWDEPVVEPTTVPAEPTTVPVEPTTEPAEPTTVPVEPTTVPVEPTTVPVEPTTVPVEPTTVPVEPTTVPVEPTTTPAPEETANITVNTSGNDKLTFNGESTFTATVGDLITFAWKLDTDGKAVEAIRWTADLGPNFELDPQTSAAKVMPQIVDGAQLSKLDNVLSGVGTSEAGFAVDPNANYIVISAAVAQAGDATVTMTLDELLLKDTVEPTTTPDATSATEQGTTTGGSTSDTPTNPGGNNNNNGGTNGSVQTGSASMALIILIVLLSGTAAIFFARKREKK